MLSKVLTIAWTNIYITYSDRGALILMLLIPVALSTLIGLAFGGINGDIELEPAEVVIVNQDQGAGEQQFGQIYADVMTANDPEGLGSVLVGQSETDFEAQRERVENGEINAVVLIPPDFSAKINANESVNVQVFYNPGEDIQATIVQSVVNSITSQLNTGQVGVDILLNQSGGYWIQQAMANGEIGAIAEVASETLPKLYQGEVSAGVTLNSVNLEGDVQEFDALRYFAPSMAILFMTFTMAAGTRNILDESRNWTLQRIMTTPTPRWVFMLGKLLGTYVSGLIQMSLLIFIMPIVATLMGRDASVWGQNYVGVILVTMGVVGAATGLGLLITAFSKTPRQADNLASAVIILMSVVGGTFISIDTVSVLNFLSKFTLNNLAITGYTALSVEEATVSEILPNVVGLLGMAALFFAVSLFQFNRRLDI